MKKNYIGSDLVRFVIYYFPFICFNFNLSLYLLPFTRFLKGILFSLRNSDARSSVSENSDSDKSDSESSDSENDSDVDNNDDDINCKASSTINDERNGDNTEGNTKAGTIKNKEGLDFNI